MMVTESCSEGGLGLSTKKLCPDSPLASVPAKEGPGAINLSSDTELLSGASDHFNAISILHCERSPVYGKISPQSYMFLNALGRRDSGVTLPL